MLPARTRSFFSYRSSKRPPVYGSVGRLCVVGGDGSDDRHESTDKPRLSAPGACPGPGEGGICMVTLTFDVLRHQVRGAAIAAEDEGYEQARAVYNAMIDKRPVVVTRPVHARHAIAAPTFPPQ